MNIVHPEDRPRVAQMLPELIEKGTMTIQYRVVHPDGEVRWLEDNTVIARDADGRPVRFDGVASDITERKWHEAQVLYLATYDALTDLPNRNLLSDRLTQDMADAQRGGRTVSVLVLGVDRFKLINDSYGHNFGDALLRELATRLRSSVGPGDTVARLRGDEFAVLFSSLDNPEKTIPAIRRLLDIFSHPFIICHVELYATASVGIAVFPTDGREPEILLKNAGAAMYWAKSLGRNDFQFFAPKMSAQATERLELENALKQALERLEFEVHYQPQVLVKTGQVVAVEALVRWRHPTQGLLPPGQFIGVAEETGLIDWGMGDGSGVRTKQGLAGCGASAPPHGGKLVGQAVLGRPDCANCQTGIEGNESSAERPRIGNYRKRVPARHRGNCPHAL
jgi:diguanylate cyclase (GGDEF)-like protein